MVWGAPLGRAFRLQLSETEGFPGSGGRYRANRFINFSIAGIDAR